MKNAKFVNMENNNNLEKIADAARERLVDDFNISIPQSKAIATIAYCYFKEIIKGINSDDEVNVLEMFNISKVDGEVVLTPGQELKLIVKDDK